MEGYSFKNQNTISKQNTIENNKIIYQNLNSNNTNNNLSTAKFEEETINEFQLSQMTNISERTKNLFQKEMNNYALENSINTTNMFLSNNNNNFK